MGEPVPALVVVDYQNIHLTGHEQFARNERLGDCVVDPAAFAMRSILRRNEEHPDLEPAELAKVRVFRGEPISHIQETLARAAQRQKARWEREPRTEVIYRPLRYGPPDRRGKRRGEEKGIDVLCAVEVIRGALSDEYGLILLASHDTDLCPVLDFATELGQRVETVGWFGAKVLKPHEGQPTRDTRLAKEDFNDCRDTYRGYFDSPS